MCKKSSMYKVCSLTAVILGARRGLKMHSRIAQILNWQQPQSAVLSMRPSGNPAWEISDNVCSIPLTTPFTAKGSRCDQSWARPHLGLWASYGSDCRVHSWLGVHPEAYVEKFAAGFPGCSEGIYCSQASGLFCESIICLAVVYLYTLSDGTSCFFSPGCQLSLHWAAAVEVMVHLRGAWKCIPSCKAVIITVPDWCPLMGIQHLGRRQAQADAELIPSQGGSFFLARYT